MRPSKRGPKTARKMGPWASSHPLGKRGSWASRVRWVHRGRQVGPAESRAPRGLLCALPPSVLSPRASSHTGLPASSAPRRTATNTRHRPHGARPHHPTPPLPRARLPVAAWRPPRPRANPPAPRHDGAAPIPPQLAPAAADPARASRGSRSTGESRTEAPVAWPVGPTRHGRDAAEGGAPSPRRAPLR
jgi:hypothetical protein